MTHPTPSSPGIDVAASQAAPADGRAGDDFGIVPVKAGNLHPDAVRQPRLLTERIRFQVGMGLFLCILLPMTARALYDGVPISDPRILYSGLLSAAALLTGYYAARSMVPFRGATTATYSVPTVIIAFAIFAIVPIFARIDYSRVQMFTHFVLALGFFVATERVTSRRRRLRFAVIPGGRVNGLAQQDAITLVRLKLPNDPIVAVDGVVADLDARHPSGWDQAMMRSLLAGVPVYHWRHLAEQFSGTVDVTSISDNSFGTLNPNQFYLRVKQIMDYVGAATLLLLTWPLMLLAAIAIRLESPGGVLFRQERTGYRARSFTIIKFRTMRLPDDPATNDAEARDAAITQDADPRITRVGNFLRKTRIDELPQLINVLRGEMSLIGPRPEAVELTLWYEQALPFYHYRHAIKPGITGWAQVNQGHVAGIDDTRVKLSYDFYYVKYCSLWLDMLIAAHTITTAIHKRGAK
ncbi:MAG: sugar transferase [Sphingomonadaceae bacterium]|nr:sugar transferase [Sphingomonadaceae bacterium]